MRLAFLAAAAAATTTVTTASLVPLRRNATARVLSHIIDPRTWYGDSAVGGNVAAGDPVFMTTSWVYPPVEALGFRPAAGPAPWKTDTTKDLTYQTLLVDTAPSVYGGAAGSAAAPVDSLMMWVEKPSGIVGMCTLVGFNSGAAPQPDAPTPPAGTWKTRLPMPCLNVNLWSPYSAFDVSADGKTAVAWVLQSTGANTTVYGLDAATGAIAWSRDFGVDAGDADYFLSYGVTLAAGGRWAVYDQGVVGLTDHFLYVLDAATGATRDVVPSAVAIQGALSPDGAYLYTAPQEGAALFQVHKFNDAAGAYAPVGGPGAPPLPAGSDGETWYFVDGVFSVDAAANRTLLAAIWIAESLSGNGVFALFDADRAADGPLAVHLLTTLNNDMAIDGGAVACDGPVCAAALEAGAINGTAPTVVVLSAVGVAPGAAAPPVFTAVTRGSMNSVSVAAGRAVNGTAAVYFVGAAGCTTNAICTAPGAEATLWELTL
jgi:hypothetical protein